LAGYIQSVKSSLCPILISVLENLVSSLVFLKLYVLKELTFFPIHDRLFIYIMIIIVSTYIIIGKNDGGVNNIGTHCAYM
jgi:hypothetical protein